MVFWSFNYLVIDSSARLFHMIDLKVYNYVLVNNYCVPTIITIKPKMMLSRMI